MSDILVSVCVITYNHCNYIRQCLDGILMQQTSYPFEIIINDDSSTDGTTEIIKDYVTKYPDIIRPIFHEENQYSKGVRGMFANFCFPKARGKYIALCEGDDYWTDPLKLQKQVDFLESNAQYSMACSDAIIQTTSGELNWSRYSANMDIPVEDIIINGGLFVQTASYIFRRNLLDNYPNFCKQCHVGDYPLIIFAALKGNVRWFAEKQVVYRFSMDNSWTATNTKSDIVKLINGWRSEVNMLGGMDKYSNHKYQNTFYRRQADYLYSILKGNQNFLKEIYQEFQDVKNKFSLHQKLGVFLMKYNFYTPISNIVYRLRHINDSL